MGGAVGHLRHLYDDQNLTFGEIKKILQAAARGRLSNVTEKLDGLNIVFTWNVKENALRVARSAGDIKSGGMSYKQLSDKFISRGTLRESFLHAYRILKCVASAMHSSVATRIFGSSGNRWYSAEIINTADPNVVNYDINTVVLHKWPVFNLSSDGQVQMLNEPESALELIASSTNAQIDTEVTGWHVRGPAAPCLAKIADQSYDTAAAKLDAEISSVDLDSSATVGQLIEAKLQRLAAGLDLPPHVRRMVVDRAMGKPSSPSLNDIRKIVDKSTYVTASAFVRESPEAIRRLNRPLEYIISEFSAALLRGGKSTLVADTVAETKRIKIAVEHATAEIDRSSDPLAKSFLKNQMAKLGSLDNISTPVEGIVFDWRGSTYKFTGSFSAVNKILGVFRYGKNAQQVQIGAVL